MFANTASGAALSSSISSSTSGSSTSTSPPPPHRIFSRAGGGGGGGDGRPVPMPMNVIVVGGSSGMGKAAALEILLHGGNCLLVSRSSDKLARAKQELLSHIKIMTNSDDDDDDDDESCRRVQTASVDITNERDVEKFASSLHVGDEEDESTIWDGLVISAASKAQHGPVDTLPVAAAREMMDCKFWGAYHCAKYIGPKLRGRPDRGAAVVFVAGILNRRPGVNCAPLAIANGALEGLTRTLALEWGGSSRGIRVNCLSPGFCDTERFDHMDVAKKAAMLANTAASLPLQRVGQSSDMGQAIYYLLTAPFCTGVVLDVDGGHGIRQYANAINDPMREKTRQ
jgi:NAD(P)-dependent dehydrogenase (short-subunit alcohol dehydrogenase family)